MNIIDQDMLWRQFGAAIDMFGNALHDCPDELWGKRLWEIQPDLSLDADFSAFWYLAFHTLFWLDLYLTGKVDGFPPPAPFDLVELDPAGVLPRRYTRSELIPYLEYCRNKCRETLAALSMEQAVRLCRFGSREMPFAELQLYNLRHVQEHGAQLHMFLGQQARKPSKWVTRATD